MTNKESEDFIKCVREICTEEEITDLSDAIALAMDILPMVNDWEWFGPLGNGVAHISSRETRFWANAQVEDVAKLLVKEMV
jgi:hypothetical protein